MKYSSFSPGTVNDSFETVSEPTSKETLSAEFTKIPYPFDEMQNGTLLYDWSELVPPSEFQISTVCPFLTKGVNFSPKP